MQMQCADQAATLVDNESFCPAGRSKLLLVKTDTGQNAKLHSALLNITAMCCCCSGFQTLNYLFAVTHLQPPRLAQCPDVDMLAQQTGMLCSKTHLSTRFQELCRGLNGIFKLGCNIRGRVPKGITQCCLSRCWPRLHILYDLVGNA